MSTDHLSEEALKKINDIAGKVVMLEADDIQTLGEILKMAEELQVSGYDDYIEQVRRVAERLILDEYESAEVGLEELSAAVEQLQIATEDSGMISGEQFEEKKEQLEEQEQSGKEEEQSDSKIIFDQEQEEQQPAEQAEGKSQKKKTTKAKSKKSGKQNKSKKKTESAKGITEDASSSSEKQTSGSDKPAKVEAPDKSGQLSDQEVEEQIGKYTKNQDDPELIAQTIVEDPELVQGFIEESQENIQMIENGLLDWEAEPDNLNHVDSVFRPFHTVKGVAGFLNLSEINSFAHLYEDLLDDARKGEIKYNEHISQIVFEGVDALRQMVAAVSESSNKQDYVPHNVDVAEFARRITRIRAGEGGEHRLSAEEDLRVEVSDKEETEYQALANNKSSQAPQASGVTGGASRSQDSSVKVNIEKMDNLIDLVGELVVTQNMVVENEVIKKSTDKRLEQDIGQLKRITSNLQDLSMSLRMVPVKDIFQKMHRIVRDLSRKSEKKIVIEMHGEQTEIDRNMVDELYEPLVHIIRNNCDHGIETPEERKAAGKPETGTIMLNAYYRGGMVVIEISDDGAGIDTEGIRQKAIERGLCDPEADLSEQEILRFIFTSGFSTTANVTDVSGRGVGMDVVKKAIDRLRGNIEIHTKEGKGTTFSMRLPLTLAIIDGVIVKVGSEQYIIPTITIKESIIPEKKHFNTIAGKGEMVLIRDKVIPLLRLNRIFGIEDGVENAEEGLLIIVESDGQEAAILIDELFDKQEIVIKSLGESLNQIQGLAGGAILADGNVGLIVDIPTLLPKSKMRFKSE